MRDGAKLLSFLGILGAVVWCVNTTLELKNLRQTHSKCFAEQRLLSNEQLSLNKLMGFDTTSFVIPPAESVRILLRYSFDGQSNEVELASGHNGPLTKIILAYKQEEYSKNVHIGSVLSRDSKFAQMNEGLRPITAPRLANEDLAQILKYVTGHEHHGVGGVHSGTTSTKETRLKLQWTLFVAAEPWKPDKL